MHVFYCDDDPDDLHFFKLVLQRIDPAIKLTVCDDAASAVDTLSGMKVKPDYLFFDSRMPKLDGIECAIDIKRNKDLKRIPLVMISDELDGKSIRQFNKLGVFLFLSKTNLDDLATALRSLLHLK